MSFDVVVVEKGWIYKYQTEAIACGVARGIHDFWNQAYTVEVRRAGKTISRIDGINQRISHHIDSIGIKGEE